MSVGGGIGAVEAVGQAARQSPTDFQHAALDVSDAKLAQSLEAGLLRASEASASSFQAVEEARRKAIEASARDKFEVTEATQIDVRPTEYRGDLGKGISTYMEGFQRRTSSYPQELENFVASVSNRERVQPRFERKHRNCRRRPQPRRRIARPAKKFSVRHRGAACVERVSSFDAGSQ
jgi:hypothetical protein